MKETECDIAFITETKGEPPIITGYKWYTKNRQTKKGGGVAIAVREEIARHTFEGSKNENHDQEIIWIEIRPPGKEKYICGCFYGPQENQTKEEVERQYSQLETQIHRYQAEGEVILAGDFNAKLKTQEQDESRNGSIMRNLIKNTGLQPINNKSKTGKWTRVNRKNQNERSIIDYILVGEELRKRTLNVEIDEEGTRRLRGHNSESDHNTITATLKISTETQKFKTQSKWNLNNEQGWRKFNEKIGNIPKEEIPETYEKAQTLIIKTLKETIGQSKITIKGKKRKDSEEVKKLREDKKAKRKEFENTMDNTKAEKLTQYYAAQTSLKRQIIEETKQKIRKITEEIKHSDNPRNKIWEIRKKMLKKIKEEYDLITEQGQTINNENEAKEYIAEYYENLYRAREGKPGTEAWTKKIEETVKEEVMRINAIENEPEITEEEMTRTKKKLKKKKAVGLDNIPNEVFINANNKTLNTIRTILNNTVHNKEIPDEWKEGEIISIYKGKGTRGKCSNERGITLSSNIGKFYERIICERTKKNVKISDAQGGGKKGSSTTDYILMLKEAMNRSKTIYITFLDVTKAYDKAWADALLYVINKKGLKNKLWMIVKKLNEDLKANIKTKYGHTRKIKITDSIRQGGVLSVLLYASMMDEIAVEIQKQKLGVSINDSQKLGCLLWMDDVALIAKDPEEMQIMLNITEDIANRYHVEFGKEKSKIIKIEKEKTDRQFKLGSMEIEECEKYKYLGMIVNNKNNLKGHIEEIKKKTEAAYQTIMRVAGNAEFEEIEMEVIWQLVENCIIPNITYGLEGCIITKAEIKILNSILDTILKRILKLPVTTPREPLYYETGIMDIEHTIMKNAINYVNRLDKKENKLLKEMQSAEHNRSWRKKIQKEMESLGITNTKSKEEIRKKIKEQMITKLAKEGEKKSKTQYYLQNSQEPQNLKIRKYMKTMNRHTTSTIIIARTRMIEAKANYKGKYQNLNCRFCENTEETQTHILEECQKIDRTIYPIVKRTDIFSEHQMTLIQTAQDIHRIRSLLKETSAAPSE